MARQQRRVSLTIPARTSSVNAQTELLSPKNVSREDMGLYDNRSKAQKILGTTEIPFSQSWQRTGDRKPTGRRSSLLRSAESKPHIETPDNGSHLAVPAPENGTPSNRLRVRASSPLLGHNYRDREPPSSSEAHAKQLHQSGSPSASHPSHGAQDSPVSPRAPVTGLKSPESSHSDGKSDPNTGTGDHDGERSERGSRRKARPPRIDLSLLFPKPQAPTVPLLSPQRMTNSPSPVSAGSDSSFSKAKKSDRAHSTENKSTKTRPQSGDNQKRGNTVTEERRPAVPDWFDAALERAMGYTEEDLSLGQNQDRPQQSPGSVERNPLNSPSSHQSIQPQAKGGSSKPSGTTKKEPSSNSSLASPRSTDTHLSPKPLRLFPSQIQTSIETWQNASLRASRRISRQSSHGDLKNSVSKKSSKSNLTNSNLLESSVLWLSSSEDEDDNDEEEPVKSRPASRRLRDSVTTYGDNEPEICTAETVRAARGHALTVERPCSSRSREARQRSDRAQHQHPSVSPAGRSSNSGRKNQSRRSSGFPTISGPEASLDEGNSSQQPLSPPSHYSNRRSRIMAVTRQEESLLEAMRKRKGKITPSLFNELRWQDSDEASILSSQPRDSVYYQDMSFLRLSPGIPPHRPGDLGASYMEKEGSVSQATASDAEQRTDTMSPRVSLIYSDTVPSPSTSQPSPLTPTLPIHRFSLSPPAQPPPYAPPPVPDQPRRHSRRRTDSSGAIVLGDGENSKDGEEFPIWALGWNKDGDLTIVG